MTSDLPDHVVVGAGAAGCVVAARLAGAGHRVLLLEAGGMDDDPDMTVPLRASALLGGRADWGDVTVGQRHADGRAPAPDVQLTPMLSDMSGELARGFSCGVTLLTPRSHGTVRLDPADPAGRPLIDPDHLADPDDRARLAAGLARLLEIGGQPELRAVLGPVHAPAPGTDPDTHVRASLVSMSHPVGTCRAGTGGDSVVTPDLAVHGVDGLRVIDASVMPSMTRGNTHAPSLVIATRACDLLLGD